MLRLISGHEKGLRQHTRASPFALTGITSFADDMYNLRALRIGFANAAYVAQIGPIQALEDLRVFDDDDDPFLTIDEAAELLRVSRRTLDNYRYRKVGPRYRRHGQWATQIVTLFFRLLSSG